MAEMPVQQVVAIRKVAEPWGWLGNMAPYPLEHEGKEWRTAEALFQAMRFELEPLKEKIRGQASPMAAKMVARKYRGLRVVTPRSERDLANMRLVLRLKVARHLWMPAELLRSGGALIVEDCSRRPGAGGKYWGAALVDGRWVGENVLGRMWMELRAELAAAKQE